MAKQRIRRNEQALKEIERDAAKLEGERSMMESCPRFDTCPANICPLDDKWKMRSHIAGEKVCPMLVGLGKQDGETLVRDYLTKTMPGDGYTAFTPADLATVILARAPAVHAAHRSIASTVERSSGRPWRMGRAPGGGDD